ncbi:hypothetical protein SCHPADRAFT_901504 [Schizopora paradoxa]|uniref:Uncharacterized protein n=1 Tax=Schizopora paradoxa TaxID=27342 RepID=A0A0H2RWN8_9AGAM|nr:hypothetical protein SCHPADRAFT_901504 [Schizopora paradoxa]
MFRTSTPMSFTRRPLDSPPRTIPPCFPPPRPLSLPSSLHPTPRKYVPHLRMSIPASIKHS